MKLNKNYPPAKRRWRIRSGQGHLRASAPGCALFQQAYLCSRIDDLAGHTPIYVSSTSKDSSAKANIDGAVELPSG